MDDLVHFVTWISDGTLQSSVSWRSFWPVDVGRCGFDVVGFLSIPQSGDGAGIDTTIQHCSDCGSLRYGYNRRRASLRHWKIMMIEQNNYATSERQDNNYQQGWNKKERIIHNTIFALALPQRQMCWFRTIRKGDASGFFEDRHFERCKSARSHERHSISVGYSHIWSELKGDR